MISMGRLPAFQAGRHEKMEIQFSLLNSFHFELVWLERKRVCA